MMNLQFYSEKLHSSEQFKKFKEENKDSFLCSIFFTIDKEKDDNQIHFDFFIPEGKKMISFQLNGEIKQVPMDIYDEKIPERIPLNFDIDFWEIERMIATKMEIENIKSKMQKIILSLQRVNEENFLVGTVFISMMGMIKIKINATKKIVADFEKKSMFDILKVSKK
ncbi:MAG: hypothetical protein AABX93_03090 [Nanoarchaeota archaeon]